MKIFIVVLVLVFAAIDQVSGEYWRKAYEMQRGQPERIFIGQGVLRYNPESNHHVLIGYDAHNCTIEAPPMNNVIANGRLTGAPGMRGPLIQFAKDRP